MVLEASGTGTEVDFVVAVVAIDDAQFNADNSCDSLLTWDSDSASKVFYNWMLSLSLKTRKGHGSLDTMVVVAYVLVYLLEEH